MPKIVATRSNLAKPTSPQLRPPATRSATARMSKVFICYLLGIDVRAKTFEPDVKRLARPDSFEAQSMSAQDLSSRRKQSTTASGEPLPLGNDLDLEQPRPQLSGHEQPIFRRIVGDP